MFICNFFSYFIKKYSQKFSLKYLSMSSHFFLHIIYILLNASSLFYTRYKRSHIPQFIPAITQSKLATPQFLLDSAIYRLQLRLTLSVYFTVAIGLWFRFLCGDYQDRSAAGFNGALLDGTMNHFIRRGWLAPNFPVGAGTRGSVSFYTPCPKVITFGLFFGLFFAASYTSSVCVF